jgi:aldehyde:ferredoxin oxidoreductase
MFSYDYEPVYALGSMLGGSDARGLLRLMHEVELLGLDVMSAGVVLAWATEAQERGIISDKETMGIKLAWGDYSAYRSAVNLIAEQPNDFFMALGRGVAHASSVYGGEDFALSFGGNEMPGYHTGPAAHIGSLIGSRHSHLDNAGYSIDQKSLLAGEQPAPEDIAKALLSEERWRQVISSLVICFFSRGIYTPEIVSRCLRLSGYDLSPEKLNLIGADIHREKYRFKIREGFSLDSITIPKRILETMSPLGKLKEDYIRQALAYVRKEMA